MWATAMNQHDAGRVASTWQGPLGAPAQIPRAADIVIIGGVDSLPRFHIATGFSGHGFGLGPGAGKAIVGMLTGEDPALDTRQPS